MNYLIGSYLIYDSAKQLYFSQAPDPATRIWGGERVKKYTRTEERVLTQMEQVKKALCEEAGIDPFSVKIQVRNQTAPIATFGKNGRAVVAVSASFLKTLAENEQQKTVDSDPFKAAYLKKVEALPDNPDELEKKIKALSSYELHTFCGLHERKQEDLSLEELRFVIGHEILGHIKGDDNCKKTGLYFAALLASLIGCRILSPIAERWNLLISLSVGKLAATLFSRSCETCADRVSVRSGQEKKRGGLLYFKKAAIYELAKRELDARDPNSGTLLSIASRALCWLRGADHPSSLSRYKTICALA